MPRRGALLFPLLVLIAGASLIREADVGILAPAEEHWAGWLSRRVTQTERAPLTIVEINNATLGRHVWPWAAADFAQFFHAALPFEPALIGVEPILDANRGALAGEERNPGYERMLQDGIRRCPKLILAGQLGWAQDSEAVPDLVPMPILRNVRGDLTQVPDFTVVETWAEEQFRLSSLPGWTNVPETPGPRGRCPLILRYRGQPVPAITLQFAMDWAKVTLDDITVVLGSHVQLGRSMRIPIDAAGRMAVNRGALFDRVSYDELQLTREQLDKNEKPLHSPDLFKNRTLLFGRTDDFVRTIDMPGDAKIAPAEFFASALATIQTGLHPWRLGNWFAWVLTALVAIATAWLPHSRATRVALLVILLETLYAAAAVFLYQNRLLLLPASLPLGLALWVLVLRSLTKKAQKVIAF